MKLRAARCLWLIVAAEGFLPPRGHGMARPRAVPSAALQEETKPRHDEAPAARDADDRSELARPGCPHADATHRRAAAAATGAL